MIPRPALYLGLAGVIPFAFTGLAPFFGPSVSVREFLDAFRTLYAITILSFMSGCIWAFAAKTEDIIGYALSTLPALYACFMPMLPVYLGLLQPKEATFFVALGFVALLALDMRALKLGQTPVWWMKLRVLLTLLVVLFLTIGVLA